MHTHRVRQLLTITHPTGQPKKSICSLPFLKHCGYHFSQSSVNPVTHKQGPTNHGSKANKCRFPSSLTKVLIPSDALSGQATKYGHQVPQARMRVCTCVGRGEGEGTYYHISSCCKALIITELAVQVTQMKSPPDTCFSPHQCPANIHAHVLLQRAKAIVGRL